MRRYAVLLAKTRTGWSAHVPDVPGCVAAARTRPATVRLIRDAIAFHIEGLEKTGDPIPEPVTVCHTVEV
jgi:predicted RNase H-like HicB family nuclease